MLRVSVGRKPRKLKGVLIGQGSGPKERLTQLQLWVNDLVRNERIEGREDRMDETRMYAEQLINLAVHRGAEDAYTVKMAKKWLKDPDLVHKLFKVLVPRYQTYSTAFTRTYRLPATYPGNGYFNSVLELRDNPYPPVIKDQRKTEGLLSNVLLHAAREEFYREHQSTQQSEQTVSKSETEISKTDHKEDSKSTIENETQA